MRRSFPGRLFDALASLRLAVAVMISLAVVCAAGTFYETRHGTPAAQRDVYQTWWFLLLLGLLGANIFAAMMKRYPWQARHAGFVMAHVGILLVLAGSLVSLRFGLDASLALLEGESADRVSLFTQALHVTLPGRPPHAAGVDFDGRPPRPGREQRLPVSGSDVVLVAEDVRPPAAAPRAGTNPRAGSAVKLRLEGPAGRSPSVWVPWKEARVVTLAGADARVAYRPREAPLPFRVTLLHFRVERYPGSSLDAAYESRVRIDDPARGASEHRVSMNAPLRQRGYVFFQDAFVEGEPMLAVFSVARAPGLPLVYGGVALIALGVAWMFYLKPHLARRRAARGPEAQRERVDEARAASTAAARSAEPARGEA